LIRFNVDRYKIMDIKQKSQISYSKISL